MPHDVIVIGGGVIGLSCAWRMAQAGMRVALLERGALGSGASGASLGALIPSTATQHGPGQMLQRASLWLFPEFAAELESLTGLGVGYARCGLLDIMQTAERRTNAIKEEEAAVREWPAPFQPTMSILTNDEARELEPAVAFDAVGVRYCRASAQVNVSALLAALARACALAGVELRPQTEVRALDISATGRVTGIVCEGEHLPAGAVLLATGAWTCGLHPLLERSTPIRPVKGQALLLSSAAAIFSPRHAADSQAGARGMSGFPIVKRRKSYLVPAPDGSVLVGSTTEPEAGFDTRTTAAGVAMLSAGALSLMPALGQAGVVRAWAGLRPEPIDHHPYLGTIPQAPGLFVAAGHYKTGIGLVPLTARIIASVVGGSDPGWDVRPFAPRE